MFISRASFSLYKVVILDVQHFFLVHLPIHYYSLTEYSICKALCLEFFSYSIFECKE